MARSTDLNDGVNFMPFYILTHSFIHHLLGENNICNSVEGSGDTKKGRVQVLSSVAHHLTEQATHKWKDSVSSA